MSTVPSLTLWSSPIQISPTLILEFWSIATLDTLHQRTTSWEITSSLASFQHQRHKVKVTKVSGPAEASSSFTTAMQIQTVFLRSCQTLIFKLQAVMLRARVLKTEVSPWTGAQRAFPSHILIAWCQTSSTSWQSSILEAVAVTPPATAGRMALTPLPLVFAEDLQTFPFQLDNEWAEN